MANANVCEVTAPLVDPELDEEINLIQILVDGAPVGMAGVGAHAGEIYLQGDLHAEGEWLALISAAKQCVQFVPIPGGQVLFPADWLRSACQHDADRLRVIDNLVKFVSSR
jgi:hypothetical protein